MSIINCPNCHSTLHQSERTYSCQNGHSFDIAKDGYINLLLPNQKKSANPGDNKEMMNAREAFLSKGYYDFLIDSINSFTIPELSKNQDTLKLLDLGCGTGYYTRHFFKGQAIHKIGVDISKAGISKASRKDKDSLYIISSIYNLPVADDSLDIIMNIFSPVSMSEVVRTLRPGAYFIKVIPEGNHMREIAELVYDRFKPHRSSIKETISANSDFQIIHTNSINKQIRLVGEDLLNQISMTPYFYKFTEEQLEQLNEIEVSVSFKVIVARYLPNGKA